MADASPDPKVVARGEAVTDGSKSTSCVSLPMPLPCITILIHGVNDVGEAYEAQEMGLCQGLNARLNRSHNLDEKSLSDLIPSQYANPPKDKDDATPDPDAVYFHRTSDEKTWSPVVPFYWGFRELEDKIHKNEAHGQWTDRYGNRLDKNGAKNGGPFANATSNLNDMWGLGFSGKVAGSETFAKWASKPTHNLVKARPRPYMLLAAKRMAMLIKMIRNQKGYENVTINVLCHSQGSMVTLAAHAFMAADSGLAADTVILQDPPYSLEEAVMEGSEVGGKQQTTQSRIKTLSNIIGYIGKKRVATPPLSDLTFKTGACWNGVAGPNWQPGAGAKQVVANQPANPYSFTERDNRGKLYLYFCPHDQTVSLLNIEGIGWQGVPNKMSAPIHVDAAMSFDGSPPQNTLSVDVPVFSTLDSATFRQRMFTTEGVDGKPALLVGAAPGPAKIPAVTGGAFSPDKSVNFVASDRMRTINGEELNPKIAPVLTGGEGVGKNAGKLPVDAIDAAIAITGKGGMNTKTQTLPVTYTSGSNVDMDALENSLPYQDNTTDNFDERLHVVSVDGADGQSSTAKVTYTTETPKEARKRWQHNYDDNSYHSSIPGNPAHAAGVMAYDLSLGKPLPVSDDDKAYLNYLCAVADWRTDWEGLTQSQKPSDKKILEVKAKEGTAGAIDLLKATFNYFKTGVLPADIADSNDIVKIGFPALITDYTVDDRFNGKPAP